MSDQRNGGIAWTDRTWNPVRGCSRVSAGCGGASGVGGCYAEKMAGRFSGPGMPYEGLVRIGKNGARWTGVVRLIPERLGDPLRWQRPRRIFVNSMSDLFHEALPFEAIAAVFGVMAASARHTFQILTKRPERAAEFFAWTAQRRGDRWREATGEWPTDACLDWARNGCPVLPNVWIGVSVEDQATADERIPALLSLPAAVRFVSYEPALGPVDFTHIAPPGFPLDVYDALRGTYRRGIDISCLDWVIVGGESGFGARPFNLAWARSVVRQCRAAKVACFVKQLGALTIDSDADEWRDGFVVGKFTARVPHGDRAGADPSEWPADLRVQEFPL